jgi:septation ring formation regulator EzrA
MLHDHCVRVVTACLLAGVFALGFGCSGPDSKETTAAMNAFGLEMAKAKDAIDNSVGALEAVVTGDAAAIKTNLETLTKSLGDLEKQAKRVRWNANEMKAIGDDFFKEWDAEGKIEKDRRAELTANFKRIKEQMAAAKAAFSPFQASLKDVESYLKLDPTPAGVTAMAAQVQKAKDNGMTVKSSIDAVITGVNDVRGMIPVDD